ncbi:MAG TPA: thiamine phosphate synthase [Myxococcota bacterium]|nr:thiamine phosphate synthase [Myxococcota bacterium]
MRRSEGAAPAILCLVTDRAAGTIGARALVEAVTAAVAGGVDWVQIRERGLAGRALFELADEVAAAARRAAQARGAAVRILINRRIDVALALGLDGVHLGFDAVGPAQARALLGPDRLVGVSAHSPDEVAAAAREGASYAHLAPIFDPLSKPRERPPLGLDPLTAARCAGIPVLAQGGIDAGNAAAALASGAAGIAVTGAVLGAADPERAARALRAALDGARAEALP